MSSQLTGRNSAEEMLDAVCDGIREALGFQKVMVFLADRPGGQLVPLSGVGFTAEQVAAFPVSPIEVLPPLLDQAFVRHGCVLMDAEEAERRTPPELHTLYTSVNNGRGPRAWSHHWLVRRRCTTPTAGSPAWCGSDDPDDSSCRPTRRCRPCGRSQTRR